ncbi:L domain-like protein [Rhizoclosmatium globosum]|uniref:L domain-like protein n=1 Tax=Rhizoclosmatium globosum TaxID=329046 RepID=A0A1Y2B387_9FUNG|nr:L domain-like protein [Rhizoclosmatium globosum]|eukprot:ORY29291.1 L domain-like protein [Rhizoclosmatium globosum]
MINCGLRGPITLGLCPSLQQLHLSKNQFRSNIPPAELSGTIPPELGNMENCVCLSPNTLRIRKFATFKAPFVISNKLTGPIPTEFESLLKLTIFQLDHNELTGPIPEQIGLLSRLEEINLSHNNLSGTIPSTLGSLQNLKSLNRLIPALLDNLKLKYLNVDQNLTNLSIKAREIHDGII